MKIRVEIARQLLAADLIKSYSNYCTIVAALESGSSRDDILNLATLNRWPAAYTWLKERL